MTDIESSSSSDINERVPEKRDGSKSPKRFTTFAFVVIAFLVVCLTAALSALAVTGSLRGNGNKGETVVQQNSNELSNNGPEKEEEEEKLDATSPPFIPSTKDTMPNIGFLLAGYDIIYGNPLPTSASGVLTSDPGFRLPIFDADFSRAETTQDLRYLVPDGLSVRSCTGTCSLSFTSSIMETTSQYRDQLEVKAKASGSARKGPFKARFSASSDYRRVESGTVSSGEMVTQSEASCCAYFGQLSNFDMPKLHSTFLKGLESLTDEYDESVYRTFINAFGTHFVSKGFMGALYGEQSLISSEAQAFFKSRELDIRAAASASAFGISVSADVQVNSERELAQQFRRQGVTRSVYTHGATPPADGNPATWAAQTIESPAPIALELERIDTIPSLPISPAALANLNRAIDVYCDMLVEESVIESCEGPATIDGLANPETCPIKANPFMIVSCADWSLVEPVQCGSADCCYQNTCYAFQAGFSPLNDCRGRGDPNTCKGFFSS
jgi:MAC/Perforin domain